MSTRTRSSSSPERDELRRLPSPDDPRRTAPPPAAAAAGTAAAAPALVALAAPRAARARLGGGGGIRAGGTGVPAVPPPPSLIAMETRRLRVGVSWPSPPVHTGLSLHPLVSPSSWAEEAHPLPHHHTQSLQSPPPLNLCQYFSQSPILDRGSPHTRCSVHKEVSSAAFPSPGGLELLMCPVCRPDCRTDFRRSTGRPEMSATRDECLPLIFSRANHRRTPLTS